MVTAVAAPPRTGLAPRPRMDPAPEEAPLRAPAPEQQQQPSSTDGGDPWADPRWTAMKWTVYRGQAYDLTAFMDRHPVSWGWLGAAMLRVPCT